MGGRHSCRRLHRLQRQDRDQRLSPHGIAARRRTVPPSRVRHAAVRGDDRGSERLRRAMGDPTDISIVDRVRLAERVRMREQSGLQTAVREMRLAYHGTPKMYFESLDASTPYVPEAFAREGFIHTTEGREAVPIVLTMHYKTSREPWVVLYIDQERVTSPIRYDDPAEVFPHIYGPLNRDAIVAVRDIGRAPDGTFLKPAIL